MICLDILEKKMNIDENVKIDVRLGDLIQEKVSRIDKDLKD